MMHRFTQYVVEKGLLISEPFRVIDVGARGSPLHWFTPLERYVETIGFEMDADECNRLNSLLAGKGFRFFSAVLGARAEPKTFYVTNLPFSSGLYRNREEFWQRFTYAHLNNLSVVNELPVVTETLDAILERNTVESPDFIKLDVEGAELDVLKGAQLALSKCLGVMVEVRFQDTSGCPLFSDSDVFLRERCFRLHDFLHLGKYPRATLPDSRCWVDGKEVTWRDDRGQLVWADAVYFVDPIDCVGIAARAGLENPLKLIKFIVLLELFGYVDYATELVVKYRSVINKIISSNLSLDLLTPPINGSVVTYERYVEISKKGSMPGRWLDPRWSMSGRWLDPMINVVRQIGPWVIPEKPMAMLKRIYRSRRA